MIIDIHEIMFVQKGLVFNKTEVKQQVDLALLGCTPTGSLGPLTELSEA